MGLDGGGRFVVCGQSKNKMNLAATAIEAMSPQSAKKRTSRAQRLAHCQQQPCVGHEIDANGLVEPEGGLIDSLKVSTDLNVVTTDRRTCVHVRCPQTGAEDNVMVSYATVVNCLDAWALTIGGLAVVEHVIVGGVELNSAAELRDALSKADQERLQQGAWHAAQTGQTGQTRQTGQANSTGLLSVTLEGFCVTEFGEWAQSSSGRDVTRAVVEHIHVCNPHVPIASLTDRLSFDQSGKEVKDWYLGGKGLRILPASFVCVRIGRDLRLS